MSNTPETDAVAASIDYQILEHDAYDTMTQHAIRLERERDEAREQAEQWRLGYMSATDCYIKDGDKFPWESTNNEYKDEKEEEVITDYWEQR